MENKLPMSEKEIDVLFDNEIHIVKEKLATLLPEGRTRLEYMKKETKYLEDILDNLDNRLRVMLDDDFIEKREAVRKKNIAILNSRKKWFGKLRRSPGRRNL